MLLFVDIKVGLAFILQMQSSVKSKRFFICHDPRDAYLTTYDKKSRSTSMKNSKEVNTVLEKLNGFMPQNGRLQLHMFIATNVF